MNRTLKIMIGALFSFVAFPTTISAQTAHFLDYQGVLLSGGIPETTTVSVTFAIYATAVGGSPVWSETKSVTPNVDGVFSATLGDVASLTEAVFSTTDRWLGITVAGGGEMSPRTLLTSAPWSFRVHTLDGHSGSTFDGRFVNEGQSNSVDGAMIVNGSVEGVDIANDAISFSHIDQNGATSDQIMKWTGSEWTTQIDETGGGGAWSVTDSVLYTDMFWGIARGGANNKLFGTGIYTMVNLGVACTSGTNSSNYQFVTIGGGRNNVAVGWGSTISGGELNRTGGFDGDVVGGGVGNKATGGDATVCGGRFNTASGTASAVGGGESNVASGLNSTIGGGQSNVSGGVDGSTVCGGLDNDCLGMYSTITGGDNNDITSSAGHSMAFGEAVFVNTSYRAIFFESGNSGRIGINRDDNDGGIDHPIQVGTSASNGNGAHLTSGGTWTNSSSREFKENFQRLDGEDVLSRIRMLQCDAWEYKGTGERHIWPCAEDFHDVFDVGTLKADGTRDTRYLSAGDVAGVALIGVKQLTSENRELRDRIDKLERVLNALLARENGESKNDKLASR